MSIKVTRRRFLGLAAAGALLAGLSSSAKAFLVGRGGSGSSGGGGGGLIANQTIANTSASPASNQVLLIGQGFKRGDIPSTSFPIIKDASGNALTYQADEISYWDDGSWRHAAFALNPPTVAGSGTHQLGFYSQSGTYSASGRWTTAAITAHDFKLKLTDVRNGRTGAVYGSGSFTFSANAIINNTVPSPPYPQEVLKVATGPVRDSWRISGCVTDDSGGAADPHMWGRFYIDVWTDPTNSGAILSISYIGCVMQPWMNVASPDALIFKLALYDGATLIRDLSIGPSVALGSAINTTTGYINLANHGFMRSECVLLFCTGALPTNWEANTPYFIGGPTSPTTMNSNSFSLSIFPAGPETGTLSIVGTTHSNTTVDNLSSTINIVVGSPIFGQFIPAGTLVTSVDPVGKSLTLSQAATGDKVNDSLGITNLVAATSQGSGTLTFTKYCYVPQWGGAWCPADDQGNVNWTAGSPTLVPQWVKAEQDYWIASGLMPPYDTTISPQAFITPGTDQDSFIYRPGVSIGKRNTTDNTGDTNHIGPMPEWVASGFLRQGTTDYDAVRCCSLGMLHIPPCIMLNEQTGYIPALNNGSDRVGALYTTLGAPLPNTWFYSTTNTGGLVIPPGGGQILGVHSSNPDGTHWPGLCHFAYLSMPWRHHLDLAYFNANHAMIGVVANGSESGRVFTIGANTYYSKLFALSEQRQVWPIRDVVTGIMCGADSNPEKIYFNDILSENAAAWVAYFGYKGISYYSPGPGTESGNFSDPWMQSFNIYVMALDYVARRDANTLTVLNEIKIWLAGLWDGSIGMSAYFAPNEEFSTLDVYNMSTGGASPALPTSATSFGLMAQAGHSNDATGLITYPNTSPLYANVQNNDTVKPYNLAGSGTWSGPPEIDPGTWYYIVNLDASAGTYQLATTPNGSPITSMTAKSGYFFTYRMFYSPPTSAGTVGYDNDPIGYFAISRAALNWLKSLPAEITGIDTALAEMEARWQGTATTFVSNPKYNLVNTPIT